MFQQANFQQTNPFLQHVVNHGHSLITEVNKASSLCQEIVLNCDNIVAAINSGNPQNAVNLVQNIRNKASQVSQSTQFFNQAINERLDMSAYVLNTIQHKLNEISGAIQSLRGTTANYQMWQYGMQPSPWPSMPQQ
ncbi:methyl-accepting chemotaxis domain-containing protein [Methylomusa anaerophila]|uniref:Uncharacterized protein n=1 Tax=Methylomusa anaerophila TaxID=1930071 RepID=A0A348AR44_9FIRM|nr:hypothetical protein [Methylomusa anaerophila]BBB93542.1 hypothetical protein MAMMFC1_04260 [Methylomusa anaerophila]